MQEEGKEGVTMETPPSSSGGFWNGLLVGALILAVLWVIVGFAVYRPRLADAEAQAFAAESERNMMANRLGEMRHQLEEARNAARRAQDAGKVFSQVIQQLDKAFKELGLQAGESAARSEEHTV